MENNYNFYDYDYYVFYDDTLEFYIPFSSSKNISEIILRNLNEIPFSLRKILYNDDLVKSIDGSIHRNSCFCEFVIKNGIVRIEKGNHYDINKVKNSLEKCREEIQQYIDWRRDYEQSSDRVIVHNHKRNWYGASDLLDGNEKRKLAFNNANISPFGRYVRGVAHPEDKHKEILKTRIKNKMVIKNKNYRNKFWDKVKGDWETPWQNRGKADRRDRSVH